MRHLDHKKDPKTENNYVPVMSDGSIDFKVDRSAKTSLAGQIQQRITAAIENGTLMPGARLPSWQDLAAQLGVARGTVRTAYERLHAAQLIVASRTTGTHVAPRLRTKVKREPKPDPGSFLEAYQEMTQGPAFFQMGVPAMESMPKTLLARIRASSIRMEISAAALYPDPRGEPQLRHEIAGYLSMSRGIDCSPSQVIITGGYSAGLGLALRALGLEGEKAWIEEPGFPFTRKGLELARIRPVPIAVDAAGIDVDQGMMLAGDARIAVVTPGQQAPLGSMLSLERRLKLLDWAASNQAWIIEDDYLSELQLNGRAAPALASLDHPGRVIHIGSFSKTITPTLRLGFIVVPTALIASFTEVAACLAPPPGPAVQLAMARFMQEGHYLRHLRRTKRLYAAKRESLLVELRRHFDDDHLIKTGVAVLVRMPDGSPDLAVARETLAFGMFPIPLSSWYVTPEIRRSGLLLGVATSPTKELSQICDRLAEIIQKFS